jgi:predicted transport protein
MPIFKIQNNKVVQIKSSNFKNERELQNLIDENLEDIFGGMRYIASEVITDSGRIDTLALDENNAPVIIEYKWGEQDEAIIQALSYLNWLVKNKWEVEKIIKNKIGEKTKIEWGQPKVMVVAQSFSKRVRDAIEHLGENIELWAYSRYGDDILTIELFGASTPNAKSKRRVTEIKYESFTVDDHFKKGSKETIAIFKELRESIRQLDESIEEKPTKFYIGYWHNRIFCKIRFRKSKLRISIYTKSITLNDPRKLAKPSNKNWEGSTEYYYFSISKPEDINYALDLIKQSYKSTL